MARGRRDALLFSCLKDNLGTGNKIVAALTNPEDAPAAQAAGADLAELRLDLMQGDPAANARRAREICTLPLIATFRSMAEGGMYAGTAEEWAAAIAPVIPLVEYVDIEQGFARAAGPVRDAGTTIIASHHAGQMVPLPILFVMERELRAYGQIPKIVITPATQDDVIELIAFTKAANKPICTGVIGSQFRYARAILPLFGSEFAYCSAGAATAEGQYTVEEFTRLLRILKGGD